MLKRELAEERPKVLLVSNNLRTKLPWCSWDAKLTLLRRLRSSNQVFKVFLRPCMPKMSLKLQARCAATLITSTLSVRERKWCSHWMLMSALKPWKMASNILLARLKRTVSWLRFFKLRGTQTKEKSSQPTSTARQRRVRDLARSAV